MENRILPNIYKLSTPSQHLCQNSFNIQTLNLRRNGTSSYTIFRKADQEDTKNKKNNVNNQLLSNYHHVKNNVCLSNSGTQVSTPSLYILNRIPLLKAMKEMLFLTVGSKRSLVISSDKNFVFKQVPSDINLKICKKYYASKIKIGPLVAEGVGWAGQPVVKRVHTILPEQVGDVADILYVAKNIVKECSEPDLKPTINILSQASDVSQKQEPSEINKNSKNLNQPFLDQPTSKSSAQDLPKDHVGSHDSVFLMNKNIKGEVKDKNVKNLAQSVTMDVVKEQGKGSHDIIFQMSKHSRKNIKDKNLIQSIQADSVQKLGNSHDITFDMNKKKKSIVKNKTPKNLAQPILLDVVKDQECSPNNDAHLIINVKTKSKDETNNLVPTSAQVMNEEVKNQAITTTSAVEKKNVKVKDETNNLVLSSAQVMEKEKKNQVIPIASITGKKTNKSKNGINILVPSYTQNIKTKEQDQSIPTVSMIEKKKYTRKKENIYAKTGAFINSTKKKLKKKNKTFICNTRNCDQALNFNKVKKIKKRKNMTNAFMINKKIKLHPQILFNQCKNTQSSPREVFSVENRHFRTHTASNMPKAVPSLNVKQKSIKFGGAIKGEKNNLKKKKSTNQIVGLEDCVCPKSLVVETERKSTQMCGEAAGVSEKAKKKERKQKMCPIQKKIKQKRKTKVCVSQKFLREKRKRELPKCPKPEKKIAERTKVCPSQLIDEKVMKEGKKCQVQVEEVKVRKRTKVCRPVVIYGKTESEVKLEKAVCKEKKVKKIVSKHTKICLPPDDEENGIKKNSKNKK